MKVALTGGTGFIGQYLVKEYGDKYEFVVPTRRKEFDGFSTNAQYVHVDEDCEWVSVFDGCEAVIHLASNVMCGMDYNLNTRDYIGNIALSERVFDACHRLGIDNVVNASSVAVYDQIDEKPMDENAPCQPNSIYGVMKLAVEKIAEIYNRRYEMKIKSLRLAQGAGISDKMDPSSFWTMLITYPYSGKAIPVYGEGKTGRDVIYVKDMAHGLICALEHKDESGVFNIGTGKVTSNIELAKTFAKVFGNKDGVVYVNHEENAIRTCMDISKAKKVLGFEPQYDLLKMAEDMKQEYLLEMRNGK
ncbi:MAG: NAD(P)-dependent oxidoreductase [Agathobacter sp.]|nr:NAD(P)-dependent oxidoreductase [Agathobacter sp.]